MKNFTGHFSSFEEQLLFSFNEFESDQVWIAAGCFNKIFDRTVDVELLKEFSKLRFHSFGRLYRVDFDASIIYLAGFDQFCSYVLTEFENQGLFCGNVFGNNSVFVLLFALDENRSPVRDPEIPFIGVPDCQLLTTCVIKRLTILTVCDYGSGVTSYRV
jgi:hypothetical protein